MLASLQQIVRRLFRRAAPAPVYDWTWVNETGPGDYPFTTVGCIRHKPDLSDLDEPYLSMVTRAQAARR